MTTKKKQTTKPESKPSSATINDDSRNSFDTAMAASAVSGVMSNAKIVGQYSKGTHGDLNLIECMKALESQIRGVHEGSLKTSEALLTGQSVALNTIFTDLACRAGLYLAVNIDATERYLRLALKAQNLSRMTLETLATIKNPTLVVANQANVNSGSGNLQVNNAPAPASHTEKNINQPNELLTEVQHGETLDTRGTAAAIRNNPAMATVD